MEIRNDNVFREGSSWGGKVLMYPKNWKESNVNSRVGEDQERVIPDGIGEMAREGWSCEVILRHDEELAFILM